MSEHITHIAVAEDGARLARLHPDFSPHFAHAIDRFPRALQLGSCTRSGDAFVVPLLKKWRDDWRDEDARSEKLAYVIGWQGHLAGDRTFKATYRITDLAHYVRGFPPPSLASVYQDAATFHYVFDDGRRFPFHPSYLAADLAGHPAAADFPVRQVETAAAARFADRAAALRGFANHPVVGDDWPDKYRELTKERQRFYIDLDKYTAATRHPDPSRTRQYLLEPNFYNPADPLLKIAADLREGRPPGSDLNDALAAAAEQSLYAQSLKLCYEFLTAASDFFTGRLDEATTRERLRTNTKHKENLDYYIQLAKENGDD